MLLFGNHQLNTSSNYLFQRTLICEVKKLPSFILVTPNYTLLLLIVTVNYTLKHAIIW